MLATSQKLNLGAFHGAGNLVQHYVYSPFGKIVKIENAAGADITATPMIDNFYTFTGREYDKESGLYYYRARFLDSETGRFIQSDPHPGSMGSPTSFTSKYIYASNSPLNFIDPNGTFSLRKGLGWAMVIALPGLSFFLMNTTDTFENHFNFGNKDIQNANTAIIVAAAIAVGIATGGTAAPAASSAATATLGLTAGTTSAAIVGTSAGVLAGTAVGATFGALTGAAIGGAASLMQGGSFEKGAVRGGELGLYGGAVGGMLGASLGVGLAETPGGFGAFIQSNYLQFAGASALLPITGVFKISL